MRPIGVAAIRAGIIPETTLDEFQRWGTMPSAAEHDLSPIEDIEEAVFAIQDALDSEEQVQLRTTDLDSLRLYLDKNNQRKGRLVVVNDVTDERATKIITFAYVRIPPAEKYIIPWTSDSIDELMTNGLTYLSFKDDEGENRRIYFERTEELFFGDVKAFLVCYGKEYVKDE